MPPTLHLGCGALLLGAGIVLVAGACSDEAHPGVMGSCIGNCGGGGAPAVGGGPPAQDAGFESAPGAGAGGAPSGNGITVPDSGDGAGSGGTCGSAALLLTGGSLCSSCVAANCCQASQACFGQCLDIIQCNAGLNNCVAQFPTGVTSYNALASCVATSCGASCPALPLSGTAFP
jgi:hypothetical protein